MAKFHRFRVQPTGKQTIFPVDMLRHDSCWPAGTTDAVRISETILSFAEERLAPIELTTSDQANVTPGRWQSFGWRVI